MKRDITGRATINPAPYKWSPPQSWAFEWLRFRGIWPTDENRARYKGPLAADYYDEKVRHKNGRKCLVCNGTGVVK